MSQNARQHFQQSHGDRIITVLILGFVRETKSPKQGEAEEAGSSSSFSSASNHLHPYTGMKMIPDARAARHVVETNIPQK